VPPLPLARALGVVVQAPGWQPVRGIALVLGEPRKFPLDMSACCPCATRRIVHHWSDLVFCRPTHSARVACAHVLNFIDVREAESNEKEKWTALSGHQKKQENFLSWLSHGLAQCIESSYCPENFRFNIDEQTAGRHLSIPPTNGIK